MEFTPRQREQLDEIGRKCCAELLLLGRRNALIIPSHDESIGLHLLERDDQLPADLA